MVGDVASPATATSNDPGEVASAEDDADKSADVGAHVGGADLRGEVGAEVGGDPGADLAASAGASGGAHASAHGDAAATRQHGPARSGAHSAGVAEPKRWVQQLRDTCSCSGACFAMLFEVAQRGFTPPPLHPNSALAWLHAQAPSAGQRLLDSRCLFSYLELGLTTLRPTLEMGWDIVQDALGVKVSFAARRANC